MAFPTNYHQQGKDFCCVAIPQPTWSLEQLRLAWEDTPESHCAIGAAFSQKVYADPELLAHREYITKNNLGFGADAFHWVYKLVVDEMPQSFRFLEIGVHCGQVLSLVGMLALRENKEVWLYGVSPYNGKDIDDGRSRDYFKTVNQTIGRFCEQPEGDKPEVYFVPLRGWSDEPHIIASSRDNSPYDAILIDGNHSYETVVSDLKNYLPMLKVGGCLLVDDSANGFAVPINDWPGIESVSKAVDEILPPKVENSSWQHIGNVIHLRVWKKLS